MRTGQYDIPENGAAGTDAQSSSSAFTVIELMASIAVLAVIVTSVAMLFSQSNKSWNSGSDNASLNTAARIAMDLISQDLECAVADDTLTFTCRLDRNGTTTYGLDNNELCFVSFINSGAGNTRAAAEIQYWVRPVTNGGTVTEYQLVRCVNPVTNSPSSCYNNRDWHIVRSGNIGVAAENVANFRVGALRYGNLEPVYCSTNYADNLPPLCVDIYLELMDNETAAKVSDMIRNGMNYTNFLERNVRRYSNRVYLRNRNGYRNR